MVEEANPLESLKAGYWGRITTDDPSLRDRVCDQSVGVSWEKGNKGNTGNAGGLTWPDPRTRDPHHVNCKSSHCMELRPEPQKWVVGRGKTT